MKELNNSIVLILLLINLFASSGIIIAALYYPDSPFYIKDDSDEDNYNPFQNKSAINIKLNINIIEGNFTYFENYKNVQYNLKESKDKSKHLYSLNLATYINFLTLYMCFYLIVSLFVPEFDCPDCHCDGDSDCECKCNCNLFCCPNLCNYECSCQKCVKSKCFVYSFLPCFICFYCCNACCFNCIKCCGECYVDCGKCCIDCCRECGKSGGGGSGSGGGEGMAGLALILCAIALVAAIIYGFFYLIYFLTKACGKAVVRYISIFINTLANIIIFCLAYSVIDEEEESIYIILGLSGLIFISNIIGIILSNIYERFSWCDSFSYKPPKTDSTKTPTSDLLEYNLEKEANRDADSLIP